MLNLLWALLGIAVGGSVIALGGGMELALLLGLVELADWIGGALEVMLGIQTAIEIVNLARTIVEFAEESRKLVDEAVTVEDEDEAQRHARHAALVRWHGNHVYLFGDFQLEDAWRLAHSGFELSRSETLSSVFQAEDAGALAL